jgi:ribosomal protein S18 acetylase RimI-like enzyme
MTSSNPRVDQLPQTSPGPTGPTLVQVDDERRQEAIGRLLNARPGRDEEPARRFLAYARDHDVSLEAMWSSLADDGSVAATVLAVPNPGRTSILFSSNPDGADDVARHAALIRHATEALAERDCHLAQVLIEPQDRLQQEAFAAGGFTLLAHLSYLERALPRRGPAARCPEGVTVEPYALSMQPELERVLEASYEGTLDCPGLRGLRRTEDIVAGHMGTGEFDPALWTILRIDGRAEGVLLLNRATSSNTIELVYIGLAPNARGRGAGRFLLRHGLGLIAGGTQRAITLAVDDDNAPALALYRSEGFRRVLRRIALICPLRGGAP